MSDATIVPTEQPTDLATFTIKVDGTDMPRTVQVLMLAVNNEVNRIPFAKMTVSDGDPAAATFEHSESDRFRPGLKIEIAAGYHSEEETIFKGVITKQRLRVRRNGSASLELEAKDPAFRTTGIPKFRMFTDMTDRDIIDEILSEHSLAGTLETTQTQHERMVQNNVTDWDFFLARAEANSLLLKLNDGMLTSFKPDPGAEPALSVVYGSSVVDACLEIDSRRQLPTYTARSWACSDQAVVESENTYADEPSGGSIAVDELAGLNDDKTYYLNSAGMSVDSELAAWADGYKMRANFAKIRGTITFQGYPQLAPGDTIELGGFGEVFNGTAFVSGVRHELLDGNLTTTCQIGIDPELFLKKQNVMSDGKMVPPIKGLHNGVVLQLESDPLGEHRILVHLPMITPEGEGVWARVSTLDAGDTRGSFFLPEIGDEVLVGFLGNDPRYPVVLGMMNSSAKPAPLEAADDNHEKGFFTRGEMKISFNDDTKVLEISTPAGNIIKLDEDAGEIRIVDQNGNSLVMSADGIVMESAADFKIKAAGDVKIEGVNIENAASGEFKADGGAGAELTTGAICKIEGSLVQIN